MMPVISIWTDGSITHNPGGHGGWAAVLTYQNSGRLVAGNVPDSTNNRMEAEAVIGALKSLKARCSVVLYTDSAYVMRCIYRVQRGKEPEKNKDVWRRYALASAQHKVKVELVKGHASDPINNLVDYYAGYCSREKQTIDKFYEDLNVLLEETPKKRKR